MESGVFLLSAPDGSGEMAKDPVCGMQVSESTQFKSEHVGQTFHFCSQGCKSNFDKGPMKYMGGRDMGMGHHWPTPFIFSPRPNENS